MKFINRTDKKVLVRIDVKGNNSGYDWIWLKPNNTVDIPEKYGENLGLEKVGTEIQIVEKPKEEQKSKYTFEELKKKKKDEQVEILKSFGLTDEQIKELKLEKDRIEAILKCQK